MKAQLPLGCPGALLLVTRRRVVEDTYVAGAKPVEPAHEPEDLEEPMDVGHLRVAGACRLAREDEHLLGGCGKPRWRRGSSLVVDLLVKVHRHSPAQ